MKLMMWNTIKETRGLFHMGKCPKLLVKVAAYFILVVCMQGLLPSVVLRMSLKEGSVAAQGMDVHHGEASPSSSPHGHSFVKSIDKKARSYLKTLERSFSFSMTESKGEDPSTMTIEFLRARLQAQRAEYKAEKQRSQQLAKKVLELEQRLHFEVEQRRKAECNIMHLISPNYRSSPPSQLKDTHSYAERGGLALKFKDNSSGEDDPSDWCSEISGSEDHPDADAVLLISPSSLRRRWESLRHECQQRADQHVISQFNEGTKAASIWDKDFSTLNHRELRDIPSELTSCDDYALSMGELKDIVDRERSKFHAVTTDVKQKSTFEARNMSYSADPQSWRVSDTFDIADLGHGKPSEAGHIVRYDNPRRQASIVYDADKSFRSESSQHHMHATKAATHHPNTYLVRPIEYSWQNYQPKSPLDKMVSADLPPQRGVYVQDFHASSEANAKGLEFGTLKSKYVKEIPSPQYMNDNEMHELRQQSSETILLQKANATLNTCRSFSAVQTRKLHGHRMSLDGGLDRLQKVGKEIGMALQDVEATKFQNRVMNNYHLVS